jgi:hypothetical protein
VTVRSTRAPASIMTFQVRGWSSPIRTAASDDDGWFDGEIATDGLTVIR